MEAPEEVSLPLLHRLFEERLEDSRIRLLKNLNPPHLSVEDRWRVFFSVRCECGTSALLYLDVNKDKSAAEVEAAAPQLLNGLSAQADQFQRMPCDLHKKMALR